MKVSLAPAARKDLGPCVDILMDSILGEEYFSRDIAGSIVSEAIAKKELTVARTGSGEIVGFYRLVLDGTFLVFAYIHLIAVKTAFRGLGIGTTARANTRARIKTVARIESKLEDLTEIKADIKEFRNSQTTHCIDCTPAQKIDDHLKWHDKQFSNCWLIWGVVLGPLIAAGGIVLQLTKVIH